MLFIEAARSLQTKYISQDVPLVVEWIKETNAHTTMSIQSVWKDVIDIQVFCFQSGLTSLQLASTIIEGMNPMDTIVLELPQIIPQTIEFTSCGLWKDKVTYYL